MKQSIILVLLLSLCGSVLNAQIIDPRRVVKKKIESRTNQKIDQTVDKALDKIFAGNEDRNASPKEKSAENGDPAAAIDRLMGKIGLGNATPPASSYQFNSSYVMQMKSQGNKKDENYTMQLKYMFSDAGKVVGTQIISADDPKMNEQLQMMEGTIIDLESMQMYTFMNMDGQKQYIGLAIKDGKATGEAIAEANKDVTVTKLNKTKTIVGYSCNAYLVDDGEHPFTVWISQQPIPAVARYYDQFNRMSASQAAQMKFAYQTNSELGKLVEDGKAMLGMEMDSKDGHMEMEVVAISPNDNYTFSTTGYTSIMNAGAMKRPSGSNE